MYPEPLGQPDTGMPLPVRTMPTVRVAVVWLLVAGGSPATEAPMGMTPPWSRPFGPVPRAGEPDWRLNQSQRTWAEAQFVKYVSETCGTCLSRGSLAELLPPGPVQGAPCTWQRMLL